MSEIRYANHLLLTDLARRFTNEHKSFSDHLTNGYLDAAFLRCVTMLKQIDGIMELLNDIKYRGDNEAKKGSEDNKPNSANGVSHSDSRVRLPEAPPRVRHDDNERG